MTANSFLHKRIEEINSSGRIALSIFLTAGFPKKNLFVDLCNAIIDAGADILEIGVPFSDPLADGPIIQASSQIALEQNISMQNVFEFVGAIKANNNIPIVIMSYFNPILKFGLKKFLDKAHDCSADGVIIPDLTIDEANREISASKLNQIYLCAPNTPTRRMKQIDNCSRGFVYYVSVAGTTGVRNGFTNKEIKNLKNARKQFSKNKFFVGFGISSAHDVRQLKPYCDGVIVGSAVIKKLLNHRGQQIGGAVRLVKSLKKNLEF